MFLWIIFWGYNIIYGQEAKRIVTDHMAQLLGFQKNLLRKEFTYNFNHLN